MMLIKNPISQYFEVDGTPLDDGDVFIGTAGLNAEANPINLYWDKEGLAAAPNPLPTSNGYIVSTGTPARVFINDLDYSIIVKNKIGETVYSTLSVTGETIGALSGSTGAANIGYDNDESGLTAENVQDAIDELAAIPYVPIAGGVTLAGHVEAPSGAAGAQIPQAQEVVGKTLSTGSAKIPSGTTAQRDATPSTGWTRFNTTLGKNETWNGTDWILNGSRILSSAVISLTGTAVDVTSVPDWAKRIRLVFSGASQNAGDQMLIQLGTSGGVVTTGYSSTGAGIAASVGVATSTAGFVIYIAAAARAYTGEMVFNKHADEWIGSYGGTLIALTAAGGGKVTIADAVTTVRVTRVGASTFDAGTVQMFCEEIA